jgi:hypothetical protein
LNILLTVNSWRSRKRAPSPLPIQPTRSPTAGADRQGRFAFAPDMPGAWRVEARNYEGHAVTIEVPVKADAVAASRWQQPRTWVLFGSLVLNLLGLLAWFELRARS